MELKGKIIDFLGDSITEGVGVTDQNNRYDNIVHRRLELAAHYNYGIGGTRLAHQSAPSETPRYDLCFCGRAYMLEKSADLIVVYGGVNDYIHGDAYFGKMEDRTPETFCGAVYFLMNFLKTNYEGKQIVLGFRPESNEVKCVTFIPKSCPNILDTATIWRSPSSSAEELSLSNCSTRVAPQ